MSIHQQKGESRRNDDIITDLISEIKVEKSLLRGNGTKSIGEIDPAKSTSSGDGSIGPRADTSGANIDDPNIDPQLVAKQKEQELDYESAVGHSAGNLEVIDEVEYEQDEEEDEKASTMNISEPVSSTFFYDNPERSKQETDKSNILASTGKGVNSLNDIQERADKLAIVELNDSDREDPMGDNLSGNNLKINSPSSLTEGYTENHTFISGDNSEEQCVFQDSFHFSFHSPNFRSRSTCLKDEGNPSIKIDELLNKVEVSQSLSGGKSEEDTQPIGNTTSDMSIDPSHSDLKLNQDQDELDVISATDSNRSSNDPVLQVHTALSPPTPADQFYAHSTAANLPSREGTRGRLRLITAGSSVEHRLLPTRGSELLTETTAIQKNVNSVLSRGFINLQETMTSNHLRETSFLEDLEKIKSSFDLRSNESLLHKMDDKIACSSSLSAEISDAHPAPHLHSNIAASSRGSAAYSGTSMINILVNDFNRNFSNISLPSEEPKVYLDLKNKDDWIKSLNSAFELDANHPDELEGLGDDLHSIDSYVDSAPYQAQEKAESTIVPSVPTHSNTVLSKFNNQTPFNDGAIAPQSAASNLSNIITEKQVGFFSRLSSRINSASAPLLKSSTRINEENADTNVAVLLTNGQVSSNIVSSTGTLTAKLLEEGNGIDSKHHSKDEAKHFVETIKSPVKNEQDDKVLVIKQRVNYGGESQVDDGEREDSDEKPISKNKQGMERTYWKPNNRLMNFNSKSGTVRRTKTIKKIFTSRSKASAEPIANDKPITGKSNGKLAWKRPKFRRNSIFKKVPGSEDSMNSGCSLGGFAAEYARMHTFDILESNELFSTTATDARRIILSTVYNPEVDGYIDVSNEVPITRDTQFSMSEVSVGSFIAEKLNSPRSVSEYVRTPVPHGRSFSLFYRKKKVPLSIMKRNKSFDNIDHRTQTIRFAPTPDIIRRSREFFDHRRSINRLPDGTEEVPNSSLKATDITSNGKDVGSNTKRMSLLKRWKSRHKRVSNL